jgi:hypothetical protein
VQALGVISLACAIMTVSFSSILIAAFSAHLTELEAREGPNHTPTTDVEIATAHGDEPAPSAVNNLFHPSIAKLTSRTLWSCSTRTSVQSRPIGGITMSSSVNQPSGWRGMFSSLTVVNVCPISHPQVLHYLHRVPAASRLEHHEHPIRSSAHVANLYSRSGPFLHACLGCWVFRACSRCSHPLVPTLI